MSKDQTVSIYCRVPNRGKTTDISGVGAVQRKGKEEEQLLLYRWNTISVLYIQSHYSIKIYWLN